MNKNILSGNTDRTAAAPEYELVVSSGGAAAALCGAGALLACQLAGVRWRSLGGVSGGSIITAIAATGISAQDLVKLTINTDFARLTSVNNGLLGVVSNKGILAAIASIFSARKARANLPPSPFRNHPHTGLMGSENLASFIENLHYGTEAGEERAWPAKFWTMATTRDGSQVVFNANGVYYISTKGEFKQLSATAAPLGIAVRASSTIPGIIAALEYQGKMLFDGALSRDGLCPVGPLIRHFGSDPRKIIACRIGEDSLSPVSGRAHRLVRKLWRIHPEYHWGEETTGVIEFRPQIEHVHSLKFSLSKDEKWLAIAVAFESALSALALKGIIHGEQLSIAQSALRGFGYWRDAHPAAVGSPQKLANRIERSFTEHGLYSP